MRVGLILSNGSVEGRYAYQISTTDIPLKGQLDAAGKHITLTEFDAAGRPGATFDGAFADHDPNFANGATLNCEVFSGKWQKVGGPAIDFHLSEDSITSAQFGHLYDVAGANGDEVVNKAAAAFRDAVVHNQRNTVAKMVTYPIETNVNGKQTKIANAQAFLAHYDGIFTPAFRATITADIPRLLFARDEGVMLGGGEVWFNPAGKVITLNN